MKDYQIYRMYYLRVRIISKYKPFGCYKHSTENLDHLPKKITCKLVQKCLALEHHVTTKEWQVQSVSQFEKGKM